MNKRAPRWAIDWEEDSDPRTVRWHRVATGRSRLRAISVLLICSFARPRNVHRLYWRTQDIWLP